MNSGNNAICAKLTANIDLNGKTWVPVGNNSNEYGGSFVGNGYAVKNMKIESDKDYLGFFGIIGSSGVVKNFGIESGSITSSNGGFMTGGICGQSQGIILNSYNKANITVTKNDVGGICGNASNGAIVNCYNSGAIITGWFMSAASAVSFSMGRSRMYIISGT